MKKRTDRNVGRVPLGRLPDGEKSKGTPMSFVAYPDDVEALAKIETVVGGAVRTRRSVAIRLAIREYAATLDKRRGG